ncbi:WD40 repeat domain-containing protein [Dactylosporangium matsuzakiense]|uniref:WD40 repeat protein n=1 Tax=Dactylosporangium matsuzakiense TaxID=53360 RepID=A0A9W6KWE5_9ACTN|nr:hypothetical protein [Dactylosporangium matsuzakiense]UWZ47764.1 hypothetical protein Dmats_15985 [Dactylosporangium matsuzakiense]GLL08467.1 hypothetical protein GCM10017581_102300 [Dactylosporangium matsuzakiense]
MKITSLGVGEVGGRPLALYGDDQGRIGHWDPAEDAPGEARVEAHEEWVRAVRVIDVDGRVLAVTAGGETVRVWDLATLEAVASPYPTRFWTEALGVGLWKDMPLAIWRSSNNRVTAVDLRTFEPVMEDSADWALAVGFFGVGGEIYAVLEDHPYLQEFDDYDMEETALQVWDFAEGRQIGGGLLGGGFGGTVMRTPLALLEGPGGAVLASGAGPDGSLRLWRLPEGTAVGEARPGNEEIACVAAGTAGGRGYVVTGDSAGAVRLWTVPAPGETDSAAEGVLLHPAGGAGATAVAVAAVDGRPRVLAAFRDGRAEAV